MLSGLSLTQVALLLAGGVLLDLLLGEVRRFHPLVGFGSLAMRIEKTMNRGAARFARGTAAWRSARSTPCSTATWATPLRRV